MKVLVRKTDGNFYLFDNVIELSKVEDALRVRVGSIVRTFEYETIWEVTVDGKDISL